MKTRVGPSRTCLPFCNDRGKQDGVASEIPDQIIQGAEKSAVQDKRSSSQQSIQSTNILTWFSVKTLIPKASRREESEDENAGSKADMLAGDYPFGGFIFELEGNMMGKKNCRESRCISN